MVTIEIQEYSGGFDITLPQYVIDNLTTPGDKTALAERYADEANRTSLFYDRISRDTTIELIAAYGAWTREEMSEMSNKELYSILIWIVAGNAKEDGTTTGYIGD
jgi:hypothetical protein